MGVLNMKKFARIDGGKVVELLSADSLPDFHPSLHWEECPHVADIGWLFNGSSFSAPIVDLLQVRKDKWEQIKTMRDSRKIQGGVKVGTKWFHSDDASRIQQIGLVMMGAGIPANTQWKTMDGSFVTMTQTLAGQIFQASAANDMAIFAAAETHKTAMEASADPASYDFSQGWPKVFGEP